MKQFLVAALIALFALPVFGQGYSKDRGRKTQAEIEAQETPAIRFQVSGVAIGFGSFFDYPAVTFSTDALYATLQFHALGLPFIKEGTSTGVQVEGHVGKLIGQSFDDVPARVQGLEQLDWRLWSVTRVPISAVPISALQSGSVARMFTGADVLIAEGGPADHTGDFDARFVFGGDLGVVGPGNLVFELYMFQQDIPIAFSVFYGFSF